MSIYHTIVCALPRLNCPPLKNEWVLSKEQIDQLLSPLSEEQKTILKFVDDLLDGNVSTEQWKIFQITYQSQFGYEYLLEFTQSLFSSMELARHCNLDTCTDLTAEEIYRQVQDPYVSNNIKRNQGKDHSGLQHKFNWIIQYQKLLHDRKFNLADDLLVDRIWYLCEQHIQRDTDLTSVLAMFTQWVLCAQRRPTPQTRFTPYLKKQLDFDGVIEPWMSQQSREALA